MYNWDKSLSEDRPRRNTHNPSFSSSLLDEIYRSIDGGDEKFGEFKLRKEKVVKKQSARSSGGGGGSGRGRVKGSSAVEDKEIASFRRACLVEKWMETKVNEKVLMSRRMPPPTLPEFDRKLALDNDPLFFSSGSSSSDSSFGWFSEAEVPKPKPSCFGPLNRPKPIKTNVLSRSATKKQDESHLFGHDSDNDQTNRTYHEGLIRTKARALKIYTSLKKAKHPISPGARLTSFINSLFTNGHAKKTKDSSSIGPEDQARNHTKSKSHNTSTCSSASSFSRSCLSKNSPRSRENLNNGIPRTVRFYPVSVIVDEDSRPCGEKIIPDKHDHEKPPSSFPWQRTKNPSFKEFLERYDGDVHDDFDDEDDDMASDSSSDLFELDHLTIFKDNRYCEELPVYETTNLGTNRAIASRLFC